MVSSLIISILFSGLGLLASASRLIWAFARDDGLPFPRYFSHVSPSPPVTHDPKSHKDS
jgi:amino acid transporter